MKLIYTFLVFLLLFFSCQKKEAIEASAKKKSPIKKDSLEFLFGNCIDVGRFNNQFSKILYSESFFFISSALGKSELYLKGKLISNKNILDYDDYDSIKKKYNLKEIDILKFTRPSINYEFKENNTCTKLKSLNTKMQWRSILKSRSGVIFQYIAYENETPKLKICNSNKSNIFNIKNSEYGPLTNSYIKLMDITGDGNEELFIFYDELTSITISFDVYQINYLE